MADLARQADVSVGTIYRTYASKADIILAIIIADSEDMLNALQGDAARVRDGTIPLEAAIEQIILRRLSDKDEALMHEILAEAHRNPRVGKAVGEFAVQYRTVFGELVKAARPAMSDAERDGAAELLLACLFGLGHRELLATGEDRASTAKIMTRLVISGLAG